MKNQHNNHLLLLVIATLLVSTSGVLGKHIDLPTPVIIWCRSALGALFLFIFCRYKKLNLKIQSKKDVPTILLGAVLLGIHWVTYFYALKLSNVAIGMLAMFTFPVITAFLEPLFTKSKLNTVHILMGLMVIIGIFILAPELNFENTHLKGILMGVFSAVCYSIRNLILKKHVHKYDGTVLMMQQVSIVSILLLPIMFKMDISNIQTQVPYLLILGLVTTAIGHSLFISSLKYFSVSTASIIGSAQPIFGIIMAFLFLNEIPNLNTFFGGALIIGTVVIESVRSRK
ncbi:DMT family transporter [Algibacter pectinivorans]|uniref:Permease of the drug/metabolite transporter (DMT) superfamily n=1 Tax=Algibacter pectinivorans TaxID=870482 RepID=A0A1I1MQZ8_9FLAO|nr:DMT family transporter [Algibacter pectinivorans]SFC85013.1 Permease of the drug/metabolite transporter (DMT) superfamily [Algibacter pectinivorans]